MKKKILIFTGSRADYSLLKPLVKIVKRDKKVRNSILNFVILDKIGVSKISQSVTDDLIKQSLKVIQ